ncbi:MAG: V-type ATP synthase subunit I [Rikenellaceae bacterium]|nr:V-type ATP synthase subunit I [Rikenellaceae bacterium]
MMKYNIVLFSAERERFIERLRELGMVDITTSGWEPTESDRELVSAIESRTKALAALEQFANSEDYIADGVKIEKGGVFEAYQRAQTAIAGAKSENARLQKSLDEWLAWGDFDCSTLAKLAESGVVLRYFTAQRSTFEKSSEEWGANLNIAVVGEDDAQVRFVVIGNGSEEIAIDAQEQKAPTMNNSELKARIEQNEAAVKAQNGVLSAVVDARAEIEAELAALKSKMQDVRIEATADKAAEGLLLVMEGWAEKATSEQVDAVLDEYPNVVYIKENPTEEDETPVKLKNNRFARLFELIGGLYALPKYGTLDMTPFFAPFYMLFFAICLNDAGYGAIILLLGILMRLLMGEKMRKMSYLTMICGGATTLFGLATGSLFGMSIPTALFDFQAEFFSWALALGVFQILFGMLLNIIFKASHFGIKSTFSTLGWFIVLVSGCLAGGLQLLNESWVIPGFTTSSVAFYVAMGVGLFMMLFLNDLSRKPIEYILLYGFLKNFASGLWDTYNNITGLLSDVLSYIRLFAIGLSGGVLAQVFNSLAMGLTGLDAGIEQFTVGTVFQILGATAILFVGHAINLFMSTISSFVHPMRLTFVEFYKNAGFEMTTRAFEPLTKER